MDSSTPFATILVGQPTLRHTALGGSLAAETTSNPRECR
jgi:hypothetical protein